MSLIFLIINDCSGSGNRIAFFFRIILPRIKISLELKNGKWRWNQGWIFEILREFLSIFSSVEKGIRGRGGERKEKEITSRAIIDPLPTEIIERRGVRRDLWHGRQRATPSLIAFLNRRIFTWTTRWKEEYTKWKNRRYFYFVFDSIFTKDQTDMF